jgi:hypothetical protein
MLGAHLFPYILLISKLCILLPTVIAVGLEHKHFPTVNSKLLTY